MGGTMASTSNVNTLKNNNNNNNNTNSKLNMEVKANHEVQHDQIPMNHSSASYKQELMDSSVLLDNINEILSIWDTQQQHTHSLQPQYLMFSPSFSAQTSPKKRNSSKMTKSHHHKKRAPVTMAGPHQTYYIKDDQSLSMNKKNS